MSVTQSTIGDNVRTKVSAFAAGVVESGWLAVLVVVPAYFNLYTEQIFEEQKILLLRSLAGVMLAGATVWWAMAGPAAWQAGGRSIWRLPVVTPVLALTGVYLLSTAWSVAPRVSMWGWYIRNQGTYTWLSYVMIFLASLLRAGERQCRVRVVSVILLASLAPALYGVMQHFGLDPVEWERATVVWNREGFSARVFGTAGHPLFLAAFLVMVVPLTLARGLDRFRGGGPVSAAQSSVRRGRTERVIRAAPYLALLIIQLLAIVYSQSRGPVVGLMFGLTAFALLLAALHGIRWPVFAIAAVAVAAVVAVVSGRLWSAPVAGVEAARWLGTSTDFEEGSGKTRTLFWQAATDLLAADPLRAVIGYGPETFVLMYHRVHQPELVRAERANVAPDRAHNETLDALITTGIVGWVGELMVFLALFHHVLRCLGLCATASQRNAFIAAVVGGGAIGAVAPYVVTASWHFSGLGLPLGIAVGLLFYVATCVFWPARPARTAPGADSLLLAALFAGVMAHFVEIQVGIAVSVTRLYLFTYASLAVAISLQPRAPAGGARKPPNAAIATAGSDTPAGPRTHAALLGATVALLLIVLSFDFDVPTVFPAHAVTLTGLALLVWLFGAALLADAGSLQAGFQRQRRGLTYLAASVGPWLLFAGTFGAWRAWIPAGVGGLSASVVTIGLHRAGNVSLLYAAVFLCILCTAAVIARDIRSPQTWPRTRWGLVCAVLVAVTAVVIVVLNLDLARADCFTRLGRAYERQGLWIEALRAHEEAFRRAPSEQQYATNLTRVLVEKMHRLDRDDRRELDADASRACRLMEAAARANPLNPDHLINLARTYRDWARFDTSGDRFTHAEAAYTEALALKPNDAALWNELGTLYLERRQVDQALRAFDRSLVADAHVTATYVLRAQAYADAKRFQEAETEYDRALALNPYMLPAWGGKALALARLNRYSEAKEAAGRACRLIPRDAVKARALIAKLQELGQLGLALAQARTVLTLVEPADRPRLQQFIAQLEATQR